MDDDANDMDLLRRFAGDGEQEAFAELVRRNLNLVHSAALRQVRSPQLAEDVAQSVFTDLARDAARLKPGTVLAAWLYQVTRRTAIDVVRREARRQLREQVAVEMNAMNSTSSDWAQVEPLLDDAMAALDDTDRTAVLLRYFENKSLRDVGVALGTSDDTAQKRVSRAVDRLRDFFAQRGVTVGASVLTAAVAANAVQAAPAGLVLTISAASTLAGATVAATTVKAIAMTILKKIAVTTALAAAVGVALYEARQLTALSKENQRLHQQLLPLTAQVQQLQRERDRATNRLSAVTTELADVSKQPTEVFKLRGQMGVLRQEKDAVGSKSALSKITADPETRKMMREQQKAGMTYIYAELAKRLQLKPEQTGQLNDLLADHVMESIDVITQALHDNRSSTEIDRLFSAQEAAMHAQVAALLGPDGLTQYTDYSRLLLSSLTGAQFEDSLTGDKDAKTEKRKKLSNAVQDELQVALVAAGLPPDYQTMPMLNFRNIASEETGERSLKLLGNTYARVAARANVFLTAEELVKFNEFGKKAIENNRAALLMNRKMMAPISK
ncbi:MAG: sigma-70 family RNA polymerase sigma factor [Verrucomicrobia bacterium]|nr:sigma-70 family RNA polymerase sigma factor [Verrucomicrobiota bacterium]